MEKNEQSLDEAFKNLKKGIKKQNHLVYDEDSDFYKAVQQKEKTIGSPWLEKCQKEAEKVPKYPKL